MTKKIKDEHNRWRNKTVSFRMSPQEAAMLDMLVRISGYSKQDYIISRLLRRDIVVNGNPRTYKALKDFLIQVLDELYRLDTVSSDNVELMELIDQINTTLYGFKNNR